MIITSVNYYSKAFDSVKREGIIKALMHYRIHPKMISAVVNVYTDDYTNIRVGGTEMHLNIKTGIPQRCTGSTILFKLITYLIMDELEQRGTGIRINWLTLKSLYYAEDGLLLAHSLEEAAQNLKILTEASK